RVMEKNAYQRKIIKQLYFEQALSCAALSHQLGKSLPLTAKMLNGYMAAGYVIEKGFAPSTCGRRPVMYSLKPDMLYLISVAMDQFVTRIAIMDMENNMVRPVERLELPLKDNDEALSLLSKAIVRVKNDSGIPAEKFAGVGIGMPGLIDITKGINHSFLQ